MVADVQRMKKDKIKIVRISPISPISPIRRTGPIKKTMEAAPDNMMPAYEQAGKSYEEG